MKHNNPADALTYALDQSRRLDARADALQTRADAALARADAALDRSYCARSRADAALDRVRDAQNDLTNTQAARRAGWTK